MERRGFSTNAAVWVLLLLAAGAPQTSCSGPAPEPLATPTPYVDPGPATIVVTGAGSFPAATYAFGQNYWSWVVQWGDDVQRVSDKAQGLGIKFLRAGGYSPDANWPEPFDHTQIDEFMAYARAAGAEPMLHVPLIKDAEGREPTPQMAADIVRYCNKEKGYAIKYWGIGNEPDMYPGNDKLASYSVADYCASFLAFASAMKAVDPTIKVMGPELAWRFQPPWNDWVSPFVQQCGGQVDIVTFHHYPLVAAECTLDNVMTQGQGYRDTIRRVRGLVDAQGGSALPLGITESNVTWDGAPENSTLAASPGTFYAGLWTAEAIGIALEERVFTLALWSLSEGWTLGFYESGTGRTRPAAHVYQLCTSHFGSTVLHAETVPEGRSVYASRNATAGKTAVMIINRSPSAAREVIAFEDLSVSLLRRAVRSPEYSLTLVEFPDGGASPQVWRYTQALADRDQPPELQSLE